MLALRPRTEADRQKLALGVTTLMAEDPTMSATTDAATGEVVVADGRYWSQADIEGLRERLKQVAAER